MAIQKKHLWREISQILIAFIVAIRVMDAYDLDMYSNFIICLASYFAVRGIFFLYRYIIKYFRKFIY